MSNDLVPFKENPVFAFTDLRENRKPFKGIISNYHKVGQCYWGRFCNEHGVFASSDPNSIGRTSRVRHETDYGTFKLIETSNSFYILTTPCLVEVVE